MHKVKVKSFICMELKYTSLHEAVQYSEVQ
jgi:hypothetical protein